MIHRYVSLMDCSTTRTNIDQNLHIPEAIEEYEYQKNILYWRKKNLQIIIGNYRVELSIKLPMEVKFIFIYKRHQPYINMLYCCIQTYMKRFADYSAIMLKLYDYTKPLKSYTRIDIESISLLIPS